MLSINANASEGSQQCGVFSTSDLLLDSVQTNEYKELDELSNDCQEKNGEKARRIVNGFEFELIGSTTFDGEPYDLWVLNQNIGGCPLVYFVSSSEGYYSKLEGIKFDSLLTINPKIQYQNIKSISHRFQAFKNNIAFKYADHALREASFSCLTSTMGGELGIEVYQAASEWNETRTQEFDRARKEAGGKLDFVAATKEAADHILNTIPQ